VEDSGGLGLNSTSAAGFANYTSAELALDRVLHAVALLLAVLGIAWLFATTMAAGSVLQLIGVTTYGVGLIGMLAASAAYNSCYPCGAKELLRRIDHAMIFIMIAGTCTPFALSAFPVGDGLLCCTLVWIVATIGVVLKLAFPRRFERLSLALYLVTGWTMFGMGWAYADNLSNVVLPLLFGGGIAYSFGAFVHARGRLPFHNAVWHGLVLLGASSHWAAVANQILYWRG
jgi:hemolysin III